MVPVQEHYFGRNAPDYNFTQSHCRRFHCENISPKSLPSLCNLRSSPSVSRRQVDDVAAELDASQRDCRNYSTELYRVRSSYEESSEQLEAVRRENKSLADEVKVSGDVTHARGHARGHTRGHTREVTNEVKSEETRIRTLACTLCICSGKHAGLYGTCGTRHVYTHATSHLLSSRPLNIDQKYNCDYPSENNHFWKRNTDHKLAEHLTSVPLFIQQDLFRNTLTTQPRAFSSSPNTLLLLPPPFPRPDGPDLGGRSQPVFTLHPPLRVPRT